MAYSFKENSYFQIKNKKEEEERQKRAAAQRRATNQDARNTAKPVYGPPAPTKNNVQTPTIKFNTPRKTTTLLDTLMEQTGIDPRKRETRESLAKPYSGEVESDRNAKRVMLPQVAASPLLRNALRDMGKNDLLFDIYEERDRQKNQKPRFTGISAPQSIRSTFPVNDDDKRRELERARLINSATISPDDKRKLLHYNKGLTTEGAARRGVSREADELDNIRSKYPNIRSKEGIKNLIEEYDKIYEDIRNTVTGGTGQEIYMSASREVAPEMMDFYDNYPKERQRLLQEMAAAERVEKIQKNQETYSDYVRSKAETKENPNFGKFFSGYDENGKMKFGSDYVPLWTGNTLIDNFISAEAKQKKGAEGEYQKVISLNRYFENELKPLVKLYEDMEKDAVFAKRIQQKYQTNLEYRKWVDGKQKTLEYYKEILPKLENNYDKAISELQKKYNEDYKKAVMGEGAYEEEKLRRQAMGIVDFSEAAKRGVEKAAINRDVLPGDIRGLPKPEIKTGSGTFALSDDEITERAIEKFTKSERDVYYVLYDTSKYDAKKYKEALIQKYKTDVLKDNVKEIESNPLSRSLALISTTFTQIPERWFSFVTGGKSDMRESELADTLRKNLIKDTEQYGSWTKHVINAEMAFGDIVANSVVARLIPVNAPNPQAANKIYGKITNALMSVGAGGSAMKDVRERGGNTAQIAGEGLVSAATEYIMNKMGFEGILGMIGKSSQSIVKELVKNGLGEFGEEYLTAVANTLSDMAIMGDKSNYAHLKNSFEKEGMSEEDAKREALKQVLVIQPLEEGTVAAIVGAGLGGGNAFISTYTEGKNALLNAPEFQKFTEDIAKLDVSDYTGDAAKLQDAVKTYVEKIENAQTGFGRILNAGKAMSAASEFQGTPKVIVTEDISKEDRDFLNKFSKGAEVNILYTTIPQDMENGYKGGFFVEGTNTLVVDRGTSAIDMLKQTVAHEMSHATEGTRWFDTYKRSAIRDIESIEGKSFNTLVQEKLDFYRANGIEPKDPEAEVIADYTAKLFDDHNLIDKLVKRDYNTARLLLDGVKDIYNKLKTKFTGKEIGGVEETVRYLERALGMRNQDLTNSGDLQYIITDNSIVNEDAIYDVLDSMEGMPGVKYRGGNSIKIPNTDMEILRREFRKRERNGETNDGLMDYVMCKGRNGKKDYYYVVYKSDDGLVAPIFRADLKYHDNISAQLVELEKEMRGKKDGVDYRPEAISKRFDGFGDKPSGNLSDVDAAKNGGFTKSAVEAFSGQNEEWGKDKRFNDFGISDEVSGGSRNQYGRGRVTDSDALAETYEQNTIQKLTEEQREEIKSREGLTEEGKLLYNGSNNWTKEDSLYAKRSEEFRRIQEESKRMSNKDTQSYHAGSKQIDDDVRRRLSGIFRRELGSQRSSTGDDDGILILSDKKTGNTFRMYKNVDGSLFHDIFEISRHFLKNGELVDVHDVETTDDGAGYSNCANYITDDGLSGFSITPSGDLISVFNLNERRGFLRAISKVVRSTAKTLDCYNSQKQPLMGMYSKIFGFKTASLMDYNMEFDHDDIAENHGMPQIAFMVNTDAEVETKHFNKDEYEEAVEYQQSFINPKYSIQKLTEEQAEAIKSREGLTEEGKARYNNDTVVADTKEGKLSQLEWKEFYTSLGELERGMWFPQTSDGDYIFETENKLIFTDGDYIKPKVNSVLVFKNLNVEEIEYGKETAYYAAQRDKSSQECYETVGDVLGYEYVERTNSYPDKAYQRGKNSTGKRSRGRTSYNGSGEDISYSITTLTPEQEEAIRQDDERRREIAAARERMRDSIREMGEKEPDDTAMSRKLDRMAMHWVDRFTFLKRFDEMAERQSGKEAISENKAYMMAMNSLNSDGSVMYIIKNGMTNLNGDVNIGKGLFKILEKLRDKNETSEFERYLVARHAAEWLASDRGGDVKTVFGVESQDREDIQRGIAETIEKEYPHFKDIAEEVYKFQRDVLLNFGVEGGLLARSDAERFFQMYPDYVPFYRSLNDDGIEGVRREFADLDAGIENAEGSTAALRSPLESIIRNTAKFVTLAKKNAVMQAIYRQANIEGMEMFVEVIPEEMYENEADERAIRRERDVVSVMVDGERRYLRFNDRDLHETVTGMNDEKQLGSVWQFFASAGNVFKTLTTSGNAMFSIGSNVWRDIDTAYKSSDIVNPGKFAKEYGKALFTQMKNNEDFQRYLAMGGRWETSVIQNRDAIGKLYRDLSRKNDAFGKKLLHGMTIGLYEGIQSLSDTIETTPRFMEFVNTLNKTGDIQKAIYDSGEITTNFKRRGTKSRQLEALLPYTNSRFQGTKKLVDLWKGHPVRTAAKMIGVATILSLLKAGLREAVGEEDYKDLSTYTKDNFHLFAIGNGKYISIPKSQNFAIFDTIADRAIEGIKEKNPEWYKNLASYVLNNVLPVDFFGGMADGIENAIKKGDARETFSGMGAGVVDTVNSTMIIGTIMQLIGNRDFKGSKIVPSQYENLKPEEQFDENTTYLARLIGKATGISPFQIDHVLSSNFGYLAKLNESFGREKKDYLLGLGNKFVKNGVYSNEILSGFYDKKGEIDEEYDTQKRRGEPESSVAMERYFYNEASGVISNLFKLQDEAKTPVEKENVRRVINNYIKGLSNQYDEAVTNEMLRLYSSEKNVFPYVTPDISVDEYGYSKKLSAKEYAELSQKATKKITDEYQKVMNTDVYKQMSDEDKIKALNKIKTVIKEKAEYDAFSGGRDYLEELTGENSDDKYRAVAGTKNEKDYLQATNVFYPDNTELRYKQSCYENIWKIMNGAEKQGKLTKNLSVIFAESVKTKTGKEFKDTIFDVVTENGKQAGSYTPLSITYSSVFSWTKDGVNYELPLNEQTLAYVVDVIDRNLEGYYKDLYLDGYWKEEGGLGKVTNKNGKEVAAYWENMSPKQRNDKLSSYKGRLIKDVRAMLIEDYNLEPVKVSTVWDVEGDEEE